MPVDVNQAKSLFLAALNLSGQERARFLDEQCGPDHALRQRIQAMIEAHEASGELLPRTPEEMLADAGPTSAETGPAEKNASAEELTFLQPAARPGAIGRLGHYEVQEMIGRGGFGIVLKAFDEKLHRVIAIKVLAPSYAASGMARQRFIREARAAAPIKNEHVVAIYSVEPDAQPPYLVMEYIDGISLQDKVNRRGALSVREILRIGLQTAEGLAAAHKQGLVHRDIKPANILLENGVERVKITDFGLARSVDDASLTQSGMVAGTPMYMSPEQAEGLTIDHRSDLFSLGTVLYAMCTGHPPFRASGTHAVLKRVIEDTPRPVREVNPDIPDWLEAIIARLHAKKPADRFQTAAEVADLLGQHLAHVQQPKSSDERGPRAPRKAEPSALPVSSRLRLPRFRPTIAILILLLVTALVVAAWLRYEARVNPAASGISVPVPGFEGPPRTGPADMPVAKPRVITQVDGRDLAADVAKLGGQMKRGTWQKDKLLWTVDLKGTRTSDADLAILGPMPDVDKLDLSFTQVTDKGVGALAKCKDLHTLNLMGTRVSDFAIADLRRIPDLQSINLAQTAVTAEGFRRLVIGKSYDVCPVALGDQGRFRVIQQHVPGRNNNYLMIDDTHYGLYYPEPVLEPGSAKAEDWRRLASTYYHRRGPLGQVMNKLEWFRPSGLVDYPSDSRLPASLVGLLAPSALLPSAALAGLWTEPPIAVVRLNVGTPAAYGRPFQYMVFYNSSPELEAFSLPAAGRSVYFGFLRDAQKRRCHIDIIGGPERLSLSGKAPKDFYSTLIVEVTRNGLLDVNTELLTREAISDMMASLRPSGILCFHISHREYDLIPPIVDAAASLGLAWKVGKDNSQAAGRNAHFNSEWVMLARQLVQLQHLIDVDVEDSRLQWSTPESTGEHLWRDGQVHDLKALTRTVK